MRDIALTLLILGTIPFIVRQPYIGILTYIAVSLANPHRLTWGFAYDLPFAQIIAIVTIGAIFMSKEPKKFPWTATTAVLTLFVLWVCLSTLLAVRFYDAGGEWQRFIKIQLMVYVSMLIMYGRQRIELMVWVIALAIGFYGLKGGVFSILTGGEFKVWGPPGSFIEGNNEIAFALVIISPLIWYLRLQATNKWVRHGLLGLLLASMLAILISYSRGAFLALGVMGFMFWLKGRHKFGIGLGIALLIPFVIAFLPDKWFERMDTIQNYEEDASAMGRINAWWFAYNVAKDRPLTGGGYGIYSPDMFHRYAPDPLDFHDAHSIYFEVLAEQGFVGLILFIALLVLVWRSATWVIKNARKRADLHWAHDLATMLQVSVTAYAVGGAFLGLAYFDLYYNIIAVVVLLKVHVQQELAQNKKPADEPAPVAPKRDRAYIRA